ncbi:MAG TPA: glycosyltransferase family 4 protein [Candidatus Polarisedimenticolia bacterium]|nr:glycosyltransferase family 4 protein [Candidatus Polarisedimenticolia bacterium]
MLYAVVLDPTLKFGSLEEQIIRLARAFELNDGLFYPLFICPEGARRGTAFEEAGVKAECMDLRTFRWSQLAKVSRLIKQRRITLVHWNFTEMLRNSYLWWLSLLHPNVKHWYTDHVSRMSGIQQSIRGRKRFLKRILLRRYDKVLCVSQFVLNDLRSKKLCSDLILSRHFINTDRFRPDEAARSELRKKLHVEGRFVLLTVAHLIKPKGIEVLIKALAELPDNVVLWIVGDGDQLERLRQLCSELHLASRVCFHGLQKNVAPFMQAADCFVCPSLWAEAAGLVNLEASASGLPVVASRIGGIPEYVEDGRTGFLFLPGDHHELTRRVQSLNEDSAMHKKMSAQARAWAVEKFSADSGVLEYLNLYRE